MHKKIIIIHNNSFEETGNGRERNFERWSQSLANSENWHIIDEAFKSSWLNRILALPRLLLRLWREPASIVVFFSPSFPFFWDLHCPARTIRPFLFAAAAKLTAVLRRQVIVVDVLDLVRLQHVDLRYEVGLPIWLFKLLDRCIYHLATELWVCSEAIAAHIKTEVLWGRGRVKTVLNGTWPTPYDVRTVNSSHRPTVFMYAGHASRARGIDQLIDAFCQCRREGVELRLCGREGDWISDYVDDPRVRYLGDLDQTECARELAECDVGIIFQLPGFYYDMVYPGKLPFYIGRGMPIIATDTRELARVVRERKLGVAVPIHRLAETIDNMTAEETALFAANARRLQAEVLWDSIYDAALTALCRRFLTQNHVDRTSKNEKAR